MAANKTLRNIGTGGLVIAVVLGLSYCSELPKYRFEEMAAQGAKGIPGSRVISSLKSADLTSPVSWVKPAITTWTYARPDPESPTRFYLYTVAYQREPWVMLVDTNCDNRKLYFYSPDAPADAEPARTALGEPVMGPDGKTFRRIEPEMQTPPEELHSLCDTDWTVERRAQAAP